MLIRVVSTVIAVVLLAGCAAVPQDRGRGGADSLAAERGVNVPDPGDSGALADGLLAEPLGPRQAVRVALARNAELRAAYARLGLSAADIYDAGRIANPVLSASRMDSDEPGALDQVTFGLAQSFTDLLLLADRSRLARAEFARAQAQVAAEVFRVATDTAAAWYELAARRETAEAMAASADAAETAAALAERFLEAGNMNRLEAAEIRAEAAEARIAAINARGAIDAAQAELGSLMGVDAGRDWSIRPGIPAPPDYLPATDRLKRAAADSRLDLLSARRRVAAYEAALDTTRRWRWLGELELEAETERETDGSRLTGLGLALELPLFDQHADELVRAESRLEAAYADRDRIANRVTHDLELAQARLVAAGERATALGEGVLPERRRQVTETQKQVNFMLAGVFELVETRRAEYRAIAEYVEALGGYWQAHVGLERAAGTLIDPPSGAGWIRAASLMRIESGMDHMHEGMQKRGTTPEKGGGDADPHADHHGGSP